MVMLVVVDPAPDQETVDAAVAQIKGAARLRDAFEGLLNRAKALP